MAAMEDMEPHKQRSTIFGNVRLPLLQFDLYGPAPMFWRCHSPMVGHLLSDDLGALTIFPATPSLPADALDSSCYILFFVPRQGGGTAGTGLLHFIFAHIN